VRSSVWDAIDENLAHNSQWQQDNFYIWIAKHMLNYFMDELPYTLSDKDLIEIGRYIVITITQ
jgi:hypothetical protein